MDNLNTTEILLLLLLLIVVFAAFNAAEFGVMAINRYRLRHLARSGHIAARMTQKMLETPERVIGLILLVMTVLNSAIVAIATYLSVRLFGEDWGVMIATGVISVIMLVFAEAAPKTLGALYPEKVAFPFAYLLKPLLVILWPFVEATSWASNGFLRLLGVKTSAHGHDALSAEELRSVVNEAGTFISRRHQKMLLSILDLEKVTVDDIMVSRHDIFGIDLDMPREEIMPTLLHCQHTRLLVWRGDINNVEGFLHARDALNLVAQDEFSDEDLKQALRQPYFVPVGTPLTTQLLNFQRNRRRIGLVVDEYGDIQGLVTLEDILEEIVGEFTTDIATQINKDTSPTADGHVMVEGGAAIRDLVRSQHWQLPTDGPKTLNGLLLEYLETLPTSGTCVRLYGYPMEIVQVKDNMIKAVKVMPSLYRDDSANG
ncbi:HlyC/CorC family transporter [Permianibacter sp. IMCC34836]|uniref:HlyC/CorC family transporter n=1 Tax=Permianibacter fluminis TaxID=2738515 RepID=UPI001553567E|nr:HlyC/CorC family transporter [Permianibacter fluminis]NQD37306.1 HlyC/CorC family transporter [Permianibacter fluminis]